MLPGRKAQTTNQYQDNVSEWDIGSWCEQSEFTVGQHYEPTTSSHFHKLIPVLMTLDVARREVGAGGGG